MWNADYCASVILLDLRTKLEHISYVQYRHRANFDQENINENIIGSDM